VFMFAGVISAEVRAWPGFRDGADPASGVAKFD